MHGPSNHCPVFLQVAPANPEKYDPPPVEEEDDDDLAAVNGEARELLSVALFSHATALTGRDC